MVRFQVTSRLLPLAAALAAAALAQTAPDADWRKAALERIEKIRKGDIAVTVTGRDGKPAAGARVRLRMKQHDFGFGTTVACQLITADTENAQRYRDTIPKLFNKVVTENHLKWPIWETRGRAAADEALNWFAAKGLTSVRGHCVLWPGKRNLPKDVAAMLDAPSVDKDALRSRINNHIAEVLKFTKGRLTEWDVLNEPYSNKDVQAVLGDEEMAVWFKKAREADPSVKLYINDFNIVEGGGNELAHIDHYDKAITGILAAGGPIDGIGIQGHFNARLTPMERVQEILDRFARFGKDLQITEFDINITDEKLQADYTRDFLTLCFAHPAMKGFMIWGFWEGSHWRPNGAMLRRDWSPKPNYDVWQELVFKQWWTDVEGTTDRNGVFRARGFLGEYTVEASMKDAVRTAAAKVVSNRESNRVALRLP